MEEDEDDDDEEDEDEEDEEDEDEEDEADGSVSNTFSDDLAATKATDAVLGEYCDSRDAAVAGEAPSSSRLWWRESGSPVGGVGVASMGCCSCCGCCGCCGCCC